LFFWQDFRASTFPSSQRRGGCANKKCREATEAAQTGWSDRRPIDFAELTTPAAPDFGTDLFLLMARPPLLCEEGNISVAASPR